MCKEIIYFCAELLNYWSMTFFGLKLFAKVYGFEVHKNKTVENVIYALLCLPIGILGAINYVYVNYSIFLTYVLIIYVYIVMFYISKGKIRVSISLVALYIFVMRLLDLWVVTVIEEANKISRHIYVELIESGSERCIFICLLSLGYFIFYHYGKFEFVNILIENKLYRRIFCIYSFLGNSCFNGVYRFDYREHIINYWTFYLICAFIFTGLLLGYFINIRGKEREKLLKMRNDMLETNYKGIQKAYELNLTLQHDYKNHILAIRELVKENKNKEVLEYIHDYIVIDNRSIREVKSGNNIINIIVRSKIAEALEKNIEFIYDIDYLDNLVMDSIDICALLANLLDNAIESCQKIIEKEPKIYLRINKKKDFLIIQIKNSIHSDFTKKKYLFNTDKKNTQLHGWGMISIENVIRKYGGTKEYYVKNGMIEIFITVPV